MGTKDLKPATLSRRELLKYLAGIGICLPFTRLDALAALTLQGSAPALQENIPFSPGDDALLEEIEKADFRFFWEQTDPETGITRDRCNARMPNSSDLGSIASTGFGLSALCIG